MEHFRGDLAWIHKWEGHMGKPYWPRGKSGITLDPGVDMGYAERDLVERSYRDLVSPEQMEDLKRVMGLKGEEAKQALDRAEQEQTPLTAIRISRARAEALFEIVAAPYWRQISLRFPALTNPATPGSVQTAFLSLAYNRGPNNKDLTQLGEPTERGDWREVGRRIQAMQQDHGLAGIRRRRKEEGQLILDNPGS